MNHFKNKYIKFYKKNSLIIQRNILHKLQKENILLENVCKIHHYILALQLMCIYIGDCTRCLLMKANLHNHLLHNYI